MPEKLKKRRFVRGTRNYDDLACFDERTFVFPSFLKSYGENIR